MCLSRTVSEILPLIFENVKKVTAYVTLNLFLSGVIYLLCINQHTKFYLPIASSTPKIIMIGGQNKKTGHVTLTTPIRE